MVKATGKRPLLTALQKAKQLREMLASLPKSSRGSHDKRDARRLVQRSFTIPVTRFARLAKAGIDLTSDFRAHATHLNLMAPRLQDTMAELQRDSRLPVRLTEESLCVLQASLEDCLAKFCNEGRRCMRHAGRRTLRPADLRLAASVRADDLLLAGWRPQGPATPGERRRLHP